MWRKIDEITPATAVSTFTQEGEQAQFIALAEVPAGTGPPALSGAGIVGQGRGPPHFPAAAPTRKRTVTAGMLSFAGQGATNKVVFQGRISHAKKLEPGRYTLVIAATNAAGESAPPTSLSFTIVS
jgi:hypothetical protein